MSCPAKYCLDLGTQRQEEVCSEWRESNKANFVYIDSFSCSCEVEIMFIRCTLYARLCRGSKSTLSAVCALKELRLYVTFFWASLK